MPVVHGRGVVRHPGLMRRHHEHDPAIGAAAVSFTPLRFPPAHHRDLATADLLAAISGRHGPSDGFPVAVALSTPQPRQRDQLGVAAVEIRADQIAHKKPAPKFPLALLHNRRILGFVKRLPQETRSASYHTLPHRANALSPRRSGRFSWARTAQRKRPPSLSQATSLPSPDEILVEQAPPEAAQKRQP